MSSLDDEWNSFMNGTFINDEDKQEIVTKYEDKFSPLNISTKTKIAFLTISNIDIFDMFWKLNVMSYNKKMNGIIKKQVKVSIPIEQKESFCEKVNKLKDSITSFSNVKEIKNKFVCKLNIGLSKKDLTSKNSDKGAFYNCFMIILRVFYKGTFKEINAKVFNTGKLSFPGMITEELMIETTKTLLYELNKVSDVKIDIKEGTIETVLVNSNFTCGFYIDRDKLADILKSKYNIHVYYDACSYPGIQCKYKLNNETMSFMIFRTGSILIVGKCHDRCLYEIYDYIKNILIHEYSNISTIYIEKKKNVVLKKRKKRVVYISK